MERMHGWIGRKDREPVTIDAVVLCTDGSEAPVKLRDVSDEGCRIEGDRNFLIGEHLQIAIPRMGSIQAQVRWALPGSAGAKFVC